MSSFFRVGKSVYDKAKESSDFLLRSTKFRPETAVICGSGLGGLAHLLEEPQSFPYQLIPNFPRCTAPGHAGEMVFGRLRGKDVVLMKGRFHIYEGHTMQTVSFKGHFTKDYLQEKRYRPIYNIFSIPYFFAKKRATFAINGDLSKKAI